MNSRTPSTLLQSDNEATPAVTTRAPAIPELERPPFPPAIGADRSGMVVSSARVNRKIVKRRVSPSTAMLILFASAVAIVLYISNVIAVGNLLAESNRLEKRYMQILMEQERLRFEIRQLSSLERIRSQAESDLGLRVVRDAPRWITIDNEKIRELQETAPARTP